MRTGIPRLTDRAKVLLFATELYSGIVLFWTYLNPGLKGRKTAHGVLRGCIAFAVWAAVPKDNRLGHGQPSNRVVFEKSRMPALFTCLNIQRSPGSQSRVSPCTLFATLPTPCVWEANMRPLWLFILVLSRISIVLKRVVKSMSKVAKTTGV